MAAFENADVARVMALVTLLVYDYYGLQEILFGVHSIMFWLVIDGTLHYGKCLQIYLPVVYQSDRYTFS